MQPSHHARRTCRTVCVAGHCISMAWYKIDKGVYTKKFKCLVGYSTVYHSTDHEDPIDESWEKLKKALKETSEETLGRRKQQNKT